MSKVIKRMQLDALKDQFKEVRDYVLLTMTKFSANNENELRTLFAKKDVRLFMVKNSYARLVFKELGLEINDESELWNGPTVLAWGTDSIGQLSRVIDDELTDRKKVARYRNKVTVKGAIVDGSEVDFDFAKKMPTREEAIAKVVMMALAPAARVAGQLTGPAATIVGQIKSIGDEEKQEDGEQAA